MLIHAPHHIKPGRVDTLMSQIDVAPTVLGLMNMSYDTDFMGRDILKDSGAAPRAFISTYQKLGYLTEDQLLVLGPRKYSAQYQTDRDSDALKPGQSMNSCLATCSPIIRGGITCTRTGSIGSDELVTHDLGDGTRDIVDVELVKYFRAMINACPGAY